MKEHFFIFLLLTFGLTQAQNVATKTTPDNCACIDYRCSSSDKKPIAKITLDSRELIFCGYSGKATKYQGNYGILRSDSTFLLSGFALIDCSNKKSIFSEGEYYTDSVKLTSNGFELYRIIWLPNPNGGEYLPVPALKFKIQNVQDRLTVDTLLTIPKSFYSSSYLNQIKKNLDVLRKDKEKKMSADDLEFQYLFLRALNDTDYRQDFEDNAPRDGYMGKTYRDYQRYLEIKERQ
tara:strand:- start:302 stop:1006 length:705 start_codon:yes stop_codon:yes gene_type:complete